MWLETYVIQDVLCWGKEIIFKLNIQDQSCVISIAKITDIKILESGGQMAQHQTA